MPRGAGQGVTGSSLPRQTDEGHRAISGRASRYAGHLRASRRRPVGALVGYPRAANEASSRAAHPSVSLRRRFVVRPRPPGSAAGCVGQTWPITSRATVSGTPAASNNVAAPWRSPWSVISSNSCAAAKRLHAVEMLGGIHASVPLSMTRSGADTEREQSSACAALCRRSAVEDGPLTRRAVRAPCERRATCKGNEQAPHDEDDSDPRYDALQPQTDPPLCPSGTIPHRAGTTGASTHPGSLQLGQRSAT